MTSPTEEAFNDPEKMNQLRKKFKLGMTQEEIKKLADSISVDAINSTSNPWRKSK